MKDEDAYEMLARIDERTLNIATNLNVMNGRLDAHADKIRALEKWRNLMAGGMATMASILGLRG